MNVDHRSADLVITCLHDERLFEKTTLYAFTLDVLLNEGKDKHNRKRLILVLIPR